MVGGRGVKRVEVVFRFERAGPHVHVQGRQEATHSQRSSIQ